MRDDILQQLNFTSMRETFWKYQGLPYGYHNLLYGWIDVIDDNFPMNLDSNLLSMIVSFLGRNKPDVIQSAFFDFSGV